MKTRGFQSAVLLCALLVAGCPLDVKVPLGPPQLHAIDGRLIGDWVLEDPRGEGASSLLQLFPFNDSEYVLQVSSPERASGVLRVYPVEIAGKTFWNANDVTATFPPKKYMILRFDLAGEDGLAISWLRREGPQESLASDAFGLGWFLAWHSRDPGVFEDLVQVRRARPHEIEDGRLKSWSARTQAK